MKTIQGELGQDESIEDEVEGWLQQLEELNLDQKTHDKVEKEIKRMLRIQPASADASVLRTYIECVLELPWNKATVDDIDLKKTKKILDEDHYGLQKVKDRILEYLAVMQSVGGFQGPDYLSGRTSGCRQDLHRPFHRPCPSGREFVRMSLGGVHDEAEIRGHRRTYVGAIPGRIITSIRDVGVRTIRYFCWMRSTKSASDFTAEILQRLCWRYSTRNRTRISRIIILDHAVRSLPVFIFITTANSTDTIPRPLLDRMELISLTGYTEEEKVKIAQRHLIPKQIKENGLKKKQISISEGAIRERDQLLYQGVRCA